MGDIIDERKAIHPNEPWLWDPEWAAGRVLPHEKPGTVTGSIAGYWVVAILVLGTFHLIPRAVPADEPFWPMGAVLWGLALLLGFFGFVALYLAVKRTRSRKRFGDVWLALATNPAIMGGKLRATIRASRAFPEEARASLYLVCSLRSGTKSLVSGYSTNLWQESRESSASDGGIPVEFDLPEQLPESDPGIPSSPQRCTWDLMVTVKTAAGTFAGQFRVPVFRSETVARAQAGQSRRLS